MTARTVHQDDLYTLARAAHEQVELPGPEGGWATATVNGRAYRAWVGPVPTEAGAES